MAKKIHTQNNTTLTDPFPDTCSSLISSVVGFGVLALVTVFPLYYHDAYYDILITKFRVYSICVLAMLGVVLLVSLVLAGIDLKKYQGQHIKNLFSNLLPKNWRKTFRIADIAVLLFWLFAGISTLQSKFPSEAFWGNEGRYSGFFLITLYVASYFLISHFWKLDSLYLEIFLISGMAMCFLGITDYFQMDLLDFRNASNTSALVSYTSTLGNINTYTAYVGILMGFSAALFAAEKHSLKLWWYYFCMVISFLALITGRSDNSYLSLGALFIFLPFVLFRDKRGIQKYLIIVATFFSTTYMMELLNHIFADTIINSYSLFNMIAGIPGLPVLILLLWAAVIAFRFLPGDLEGKLILPKYIWGFSIIIVFMIVIIMFIDANISGHEARYGILGNYLVFNDSWGNLRGYAWKKTMWLYNQLPLNQKLFGSGPDTYGALIKESLYFVMIQDTGVYFDNAHNAYLHYLITHGFFGLVSYVIFLGSAFCRFFRNLTKNSYVFAALVAAVCYAVQGSVNLELPIVTPTFWLLLSIGMAGCRKDNTLP